MIVREPPSLFQLLFVMRGSIVPKIAARVLAFALIAGVVAWVDAAIVPLPHVSIAAMGIFGHCVVAVPGVSQQRGI